MNIHASKILALLFIPLLMFLNFVAASWGIADLYFRPSSIQLDKWRNGEVTLTKTDWENLESSFSKGMDHNPGNPNIHEYLGMSMEGRFSSIESDNSNAIQYRQLAKEHYKKSIQLRPTWPYAWIKLALVKYRSDEIDDEFHQAIKNAVQFGPREPGIQRMVIDIGLHGWNKFNQNDRIFTMDMIDKALNHREKRHIRKVMQIVKHRGFLFAVCPVYNSNPIVNRVCQRQYYKNKK